MYSGIHRTTRCDQAPLIQACDSGLFIILEVWGRACGDVSVFNLFYVFGLHVGPEVMSTQQTHLSESLLLSV